MIKVSIKGDKWTFALFDHDSFISRFGECDMAAFTDTKHRQVFFDVEDFTLETVRHEMLHVYVSYLRLEAVALEEHQTEEIYAELFAKDGPQMMQKSTYVFNKLRELE